MAQQIRHICIIGGGKMGQNLFYFFAEKNYRIHWVLRSNIDKTRKKYHRKLNRLLKNDLISEETYNYRLLHHQIGNSLLPAAASDLVIECIREDLAAKRMLMEEIATIFSEDSIVATNSSSFLPQMLTDDPNMHNRLLGTHFFFPVETKTIVELVAGAEINPEISERVIIFLEENKRKVLLQNEKDALLMNRILLRLQSLVFNFSRENGFSFRQMDQILEKQFMSIGIFAMMDIIGLDLILKSSQTYLKDTKDLLVYQGLLDHIDSLVRAGKTGKLAGEGFFKYPLEIQEDELKFKSDQLEEIKGLFEEVYLWGRKITKLADAELKTAMVEILEMETDF